MGKKADSHVHNGEPTVPRRPSVVSTSDEAASQASPKASSPKEADGEAVVDEPPAFDPLIWLSEQLRRSALGPTDKYRDQIEQRVMEQINAANAREAASLEEGADG